MNQSRRSIPHLFAALTASTLTAGSFCQAQAPSNDPVKTEVQPVSPTGSVSGEVRNLADNTVISGAKVVVSAGGFRQEVLTAADTGQFTVTGVPAGGNVTVSIKKDGFHEALLSVPLGNSAGQFPAANGNAFVGPVWMLAYGTTPLKVQVLRPDGAPASAATVVMNFPVAFAVASTSGSASAASGGTGAGAPVPMGLLHESVTTDATGAATLGSLPDPTVLVGRLGDLSINLTVGPPANSTPPMSGLTKNVKLTEIITGGNQVRLTLTTLAPGTALLILSSNLPDLLGTTATGYPTEAPGYVKPNISPATDNRIRVVFNQPVKLSTVEATPVTEDGSSLAGNGQVERMDVLGADGTPVRDATGATTNAGSDYRVDIVVPNLLGGTEANMLLVAQTVDGTQAFRKAVPLYVEPEAGTASPVVSVQQITSSATNPVDGGGFSGDGRLGAGELAYITLAMSVGGRLPSGAVATPGELMPIRVTLSQPGTGTTLRGFARIEEPAPPPPFAAGGFTTRLKFTPTAGETGLLQGGISTTVRLEFNDAPVRDGGVSTTSQYAMTTPDGVPMRLVTGSAPLTLLPGG